MHMFHIEVSERSGFDVWVCSVFKRLRGLVLICGYVQCLSV